MERNLKISIVTPNFNGEKYLEETILSVISQNYPNIEYIIIDGGSTDGSIDIIKKYEKYISFWISEPDTGLYHALQKGFEKSTGDIMGWINSDDILHPGALAIITELFDTYKEIHWLTGSQTLIDEKSRTTNAFSVQRWSKFDFYLGNYKWIQQESTYWRRDLWEKAGKKLAIQLKYAGDFELWLRFFRYEKLYSTNALIGGFRQRKGQISDVNYVKYIDEINQCRKKEILNNKDKTKVFFLVSMFSFLRILKLLRIFNHQLFDRLIKERFFEYPDKIIFNKVIQKFELKKE